MKLKLTNDLYQKKMLRFLFTCPCFLTFILVQVLCTEKDLLCDIIAEAIVSRMNFVVYSKELRLSEYEGSWSS